MISGPVIVVDQLEAGAAAPLPPGIWPAELEVETYARTGDALHALQQLQGAARAPAAVVLRCDPRSALAAARQVHALDPLVQMVFLADPQETDRLRQQMGLAPRIGTYWSIAAPGARELPRLLADAVRSTQQRRQLRTTLDRVRAQIPSPPPADGADYRRLLISDRYLVAILTHAHDAILSVDERGKILTANQATTRLSGYASGELLAQPLTMLARPQEAGAVQELLRAVGGGEPQVRREMRVKHREGGEVDVDIMLAPVRDDAGRLLGISAILRDISDRKRAEAALREQQEWLRVTLSSIGDAVIATDTAGCVTFINPVGAALTGWSQEDAHGRPLEDVFVIINEHTRQPTEHPVGRVLREGVIVGLANHTVLVARDRSERPIDDSAAPIRDSDGKILGVVLVFHDVSERRQMERQLQEKADRLAESDKRKDEFLALLGHELRNPLAPIRTGLEVMKLARDDPATLDAARETMERQMQQLVTLVDDLLDVSRITRGSLKLRKSVVALTDAVQSAVEASRPFIDAAGHELQVVLPAGPVYLHADPNRLAQVLSNLLNNAAKYTPARGRIWLSAQREGKDVVLTVQDTGVGIPEDMLERIFEMFAQIKRPVETVDTGLGIGLTLVKSLVEMHDGRVEVHSEGPGRGSRFTIRLPVLSETSAEEQIPARSGDQQSVESSRRVLIVDDNEAAAEMLRMIVQMFGNEVRTAHDGQQAIEVAAEFLPDVVLMDLGMPKMNGYEAARHIRRQPWGEQMMLVALTGWGQEGDKQRTKEAGFDYHLVKPAEASELRRLLEQPRQEFPR